MRKLEICAGSIESVKAALQGGADRVELCSALAEGGVTPSIGLMRSACALSGIKVNVLIRPRGGDFLYTDDELEIMINDIQAARAAGANAVVIGALTADGDIDLPACRRMIAAADGMSVTFHRAFDMVRNPEQALEDIIALGCHRILTSGLMPTAEAGIPNLRRLVQLSAGRIIIMPGSGVTPLNAAKILNQTGAEEIHASARASRKSEMRFLNPTVTMGANNSDEYERKETSPQIVAQIVTKINLS